MDESMVRVLIGDHGIAARGALGFVGGRQPLFEYLKRVDEMYREMEESLDVAIESGWKRLARAGWLRRRGRDVDVPHDGSAVRDLDGEGDARAAAEGEGAKKVKTRGRSSARCYRISDLLIRADGPVQWPQALHATGLRCSSLRRCPASEFRSRRYSPSSDIAVRP